MDSDDWDDFMDFTLFALMGYAAYETLNSNEGKHEIRAKRVRDANPKKEDDDFYAVNYMEEQKKNPEEFLKLTSMTVETFEKLSDLTEPHLEKKSWRQSIPSNCRLFVTLVYISQGSSRIDLCREFRIGQSTLNNIFYDTLDALWNVLQPLYLAPPKAERWKEIANDFQTKCNLPNCVSAVDGKQIVIRCARCCRSEYANQLISIELLAACDTDYKFTGVDVETHVDQVKQPNSFRDKLLTGNLGLPPPSVLPYSNVTCNYYLVGNSMFPLKTYLLRPYPERQIDAQQANLNSRLACAQNIIENAFGVLLARWRVLQTHMIILPENAKRIVKACFVLHNYCISHDRKYCPKGFVDTYSADNEIVHSGEWRKNTKALERVKTIGSNTASNLALNFRESLKEYFIKEKIKREVE